MRNRLTAVSLIAALLTPASSASAQRGLASRVDRLLDAAPFDRATWGVVLMDTAGRVLYERNADRLFVPASNTKLVVTAAASTLLPEDFRIGTSVYGTGPIEDGVLRGDLVVYGRGDPTFSARCYGPDTLALGACDLMWSRMEALADSLLARGVRRVAGAIVGDGSYFEPRFVHEAWEHYDLNWWYAAPVSALGFNDNSLNVQWAPGPRIGAPAQIAFDPALGDLLFENRTFTADSGSETTLDFFRDGVSERVWAEGAVAMHREPKTEYFAVPDPNRYFALALRAALADRGIAVGGPTRSTTDSLRYRALRETPALVTVHSRPRDDLLFPILNSSQNWFAEMLLKVLGRVRGDGGTWEDGLEVERRFLIDSVGIDSTAFSLSDGSGLSSRNRIAPRVLAELLRYVRSRPGGEGFLRGLARAGGVGSLEERFVDTPLEGRVLAKTGSISHVNTLSGYIERERGGPLIFSVMANDHAARYSEALKQIDAVILELGR